MNINLGAIFPGLFFLVFYGIFALVIATILVAVVKGLATWMYNNGQPVLSTDARVIAKRSDVRGHVNGPRRTWTDYYCTFELPHGSRREFSISGEESGLLVEGDAGTLTYQGTRYRGFRRHNISEKRPRESQTEF